VGSEVRRCGFDVLVLAAKEFQPLSELFPGVEVIHVPIDDAQLSRWEWKSALSAADIVARRVRGGKRALITCYMGWNRSGLITALTLYMLTGEPGAKIVQHVQRQRSHALTNPSFVAALRALR